MKRLAFRCWTSTTIFCAVFFVTTAHAAGVVGTGTAASCTDAALDAALAGGGLVTFNCGGPATIDVSTGTGTKTIAADTTIDGGRLITISGGNSVRVFQVSSGVHFSVENLRIANGLGMNTRAGRVGGGIFNDGGTLSVTNSTFAGNSDGVANGSPGGAAAITNSTFIDNTGGVLNGGAAAITSSTFIGNSRAVGGGILNLGEGGTLSVTNSTFTRNTADNSGGGISNLSGTLSVTNSTLVGNSAGAGGGGAIENQDTLTLRDSTVSGNSRAGAAISGSGSVAMTNTIVANNPGGNCDLSGFIDGGHNIDDGTSCGFSAANGSLSNTDPQLDPAGLQDNGGPTQTVALCTAAGVPAGCTAASPAIDTGDDAVCTAAPVNGRDQRGFGRPGSGHTHCSMGAYEAGGTPPQVCDGDCNNDGHVTIDELLTLANIKLGNAQASACQHGIPTGAEVNIALVIQAVNNALTQCGG